MAVSSSSKSPLEAETASDGEQVRTAWLKNVFETYQPVLLSYARRMTRGKQIWAEEAVQETFLRLCRQSAKPDDDHLRAWLFTVCRSRVIDMHRTEHSTLPDGSTGIVEVAHTAANYDSSDLPEMQIQRHEEQQRLRALVEQLPERQRELLHLKIHGQLSYRQMAEATGISISNVGFLLHQAMRTLREKLTSDEAVC